MPYPFTTNRRSVLRAMAAAPIGIGLASAGVITPAAAAATGPRELRAGMAGADVRELQIRVAGWASEGARQTYLAVSGSFDAATEAAVRRFQHAHGLPVDGVVDAATHDRLAALATADGSTAHFEWAQFASPDGGGFAGGAADAAAVRENVRRLMYKLEALRHKAGGRDVVVCGGFHSTSHQDRLPGPAAGTHPGGHAADITVAGMSTYAVYRVAQTCGFSGLGSYTQSWLHCDSRAEYDDGAPASWSWASGVI
jgi:zinc D-Ala-D-Ala carboxypeptidase